MTTRRKREGHFLQGVPQPSPRPRAQASFNASFWHSRMTCRMSSHPPMRDSPSQALSIVVWAPERHHVRAPGYAVSARGRFGAVARA